MTNNLPKSPFPNVITLGIRVSTDEFGGGREERGTDIQSITLRISRD